MNITYLLKTQFKFQSYHSTALIVANFCDDLVFKKDKENVTCSIFVDLKKSFDTVDHSILLKNLDWYGIKGITFNIICDYLHNRI